MAATAGDWTAFDETVVFLSHFNDLKDPRQQGKVDYPLEEILLLRLIAVLAGAETITAIALFGRKKLASALSPMARRRTTILAISSPCWTTSSSSAASSPGSRR